MPMPMRNNIEEAENSPTVHLDANFLSKIVGGMSAFLDSETTACRERILNGMRKTRFSGDEDQGTMLLLTFLDRQL
jgi:hypothetical protein